MKIKNKSYFIFGMVCAVIGGPAFSDDDFRNDYFDANQTEKTRYDTMDPLYLTDYQHLLSASELSIADSVVRINQKLSFGVYDILTVGADINYRQDLNGPEDGFSGIGLSMAYRLSANSRILSDILGGVNFGGKTRVPDYADTVYSFGWRLGRQWSWVTISGTVQSGWIFDETRGMAIIDFIPEAYFRFTSHWTGGVGLDFRKATNPYFNDSFGKLLVAYKIGRTMYSGKLDYGFNQEEVKIGAGLNILF